jgi:hypothetical protein
MAKLGDLQITFEIEPVAKLICHSFECKHNLSRYAGAYCNLKHLEIGERHECMNYESAEQKVSNE